jgi:hypothetical protein
LYEGNRQFRYAGQKSELAQSGIFSAYERIGQIQGFSSRPPRHFFALFAVKSF